jgi:hypothetical protein
MIKVYVARSMTGRVKEEVVNEAKTDKTVMESAGFTVLCPVISEEVRPTKEVLLSSRKAMDQYWPRDKQMIREANILFDMTPERKSEGVAHEIGYARYHLWKPVFRVYRDGKLPVASSVAYYEDDFICSSLDEAIAEAIRVHGTKWKRFKWRIGIYRKSWLRAFAHRLQEWGK